MKINETLKARYRQQGYWGDATLADYWRLSAKAFADKQAVSDNHGTRYTYRELDEAASTLASWLVEQGIQPGDRVALQLPGWCEFTLIYLACLKSGAVVVPLLPAFRESELAWILNKCQARILFTPTRFKHIHPIQMLPALRPLLPYLESVVAVEKFEPAAQGITLNQILASHTPSVNEVSTHGDDLAVLLFTSGTEGHPKGVMLTHNNLIASERAYCATLNLNETDTILMPAPLAHATGFMHGVTAPFMIGARSVLMDVFVAEQCLDIIEREQCTCIMGATPFACDLLKVMQCREQFPSSLRFFLCGGTTIPATLVRDYHKAGIPLLGVYGSTESAPHAIVRPQDALLRQVSTDGAPVAGVEVKVVDKKRNTLGPCTEGEEASRGPNVFVGYFDEPELTAQALDDAGWYYSGDYCQIDKAGYVKITGRKKDIIVRGGENISSREVEDILLQHPAISDAAVVAMPDIRLGERTCAYVILKNAASPMTLADIIAFFSSKRIAKYKYPEHLVIIDILPRTASGKIKKFLLRKDIVQRLALTTGETQSLPRNKVNAE